MMERQVYGRSGANEMERMIRTISELINGVQTEEDIQKWMNKQRCLLQFRQMHPSVIEGAVCQFIRHLI